MTGLEPGKRTKSVDWNDWKTVSQQTAEPIRRCWQEVRQFICYICGLSADRRKTKEDNYKQAKVVWDKVCERIRNKITLNDFDIHFNFASPRCILGTDKLIIEVLEFSEKHFEKRFSCLIKKALWEITQQEMEIVFHVKDKKRGFFRIGRMKHGRKSTTK